MHLVVECACGQRMRVPEERRGKRGKCVNCGAVLRIDDTTIYREVKEKAGVASFESDGDPEPAPARAFQAAPEPQVPPEPERTAHNPWGDDEHAAHAAPDFIDPIRRPDPWASRRAVVKEVRRDCCVRCGRDFRGEWDRHEKEDGTVCNICANLAEHIAPPMDAPRLPDHLVAPPTRDELRAMRGLESEKPQTDPDRYRGLKPFLAIFGVVMLAILVLPVEEWVADISVRELNDAPKQLTPFSVRGLWALVLVFIFVKEWLAVFLGVLLSGGDRDRFLVEAFDAAKYALILSFFAYGSNFIFIGPGGISFVAFCFFLLHAVLPVLVIWAFTDFEGRHVLPVFLMRFVLTPVMFMVKGLIMGLFGVALA